MTDRQVAQIDLQKELNIPPPTAKKEQAPRATTRDEYLIRKRAESKTDSDIISNSNIPAFIATAPWYASSSTNRLLHQRKTAKESLGIESEPKMIIQTECVKRFKKGACENCGSMSHKTKECLERPRAKRKEVLEGADVQVIDKTRTGNFEAKRDRWAGYDPDEYQGVIESYEQLEAERKKLKPEGSEDEEPLEQNFAPITETEKTSRMVLRNLRFRQDTAKYLLNLDPESAYYDPKTRSMRENPHPNKPDAEYAGDNAVRLEGLAKEVPAMQVFAWHSQRKELHAQAMPTATEREFRKHKEQNK